MDRADTPHARAVTCVSRTAKQKLVATGSAEAGRVGAVQRRRVPQELGALFTARVTPTQPPQQAPQAQRSPNQRRVGGVGRTVEGA